MVSKVYMYILVHVQRLHKADGHISARDTRAWLSQLIEARGLSGCL